MKKKIVLITGIRPNIVKAFSLYKALIKEKKFEVVLLHTDQHFDDEMFKLFWKEFNLPKPILLDLKYNNNAERFGNIINLLSLELVKLKPNLVVVFGDGDSTLAAAITAKKLGLKLAHVEAGLRSFDDDMPEEINRIATDHMADLLFTSEDDADFNLITENIDENKIFFVGNIMIDTLVSLKNRINDVPVNLLKKNSYILLTLHRPSNVDNIDNILNIFKFIAALPYPIIFPIHPRTEKNLEELKIFDKIPKNVEILAPLKYIDFLSFEKNALAVLTDSGGVQEETTYLGVPCLTLRENTERPITLGTGTNNLVLDEIMLCNSDKEYVDLFERVIKKVGTIPVLWDGKTSERIVTVIKNKLK